MGRTAAASHRSGASWSSAQGSASTGGRSWAQPAEPPCLTCPAGFQFIPTWTCTAPESELHGRHCALKLSGPLGRDRASVRHYGAQGGWQLPTTGGSRFDRRLSRPYRSSPGQRFSLKRPAHLDALSWELHLPRQSSPQGRGLVVLTPQRWYSGLPHGRPGTRGKFTPAGNFEHRKLWRSWWQGEPQAANRAISTLRQHCRGGKGRAARQVV